MFQLNQCIKNGLILLPADLLGAVALLIPGLQDIRGVLSSGLPSFLNMVVSRHSFINHTKCSSSLAMLFVPSFFNQIVFLLKNFSIVTLDIYQSSLQQYYYWKMTPTLICFIPVYIKSHYVPLSQSLVELSLVTLEGYYHDQTTSCLITNQSHSIPFPHSRAQLLWRCMTIFILRNFINIPN